MKKWAEQIIAEIDTKLAGAKERDLRFFRLDEFKRNIHRIDEFSGSCTECRHFKADVEAISRKVDEAVHVPGPDRRELDRIISRLSNHMMKAHDFYAPYYFNYLYSFFGMIAGTLAGYLAMKIFPAASWAALAAGFTIGLVAGQIIGGNKDRKIRHNNRLM